MIGNEAQTVTVNHGGVLVMASSDISLSPIAVPDQPSTFEMVCVRAVTEQFSAIVVVVYRPGSVTVQQSFHDELAAVLDRVAVYQEPIYVVGDVNIRLAVTTTHTPINYAYTGQLLWARASLHGANSPARRYVGRCHYTQHYWLSQSSRD